MEVSQKQAYIFKNKELKKNIDASYTIDEITSSGYFEKYFPEYYNKEKNLALIFKNNKKEQVLSIFTKRFKSSIYNFSQKNPLQGVKRAQYFPHYILSLQCHQK